MAGRRRCLTMTSGGLLEAKRASGYLVYAQLALGMALFGSATPASRIVATTLPVFVGSGLRTAIGALVLLPFAWRYRNQLALLTRRDWLLLSMISTFGVFLLSVSMLYGMRLVSGVTGAVVMSTTPAVTATASMLFFGDRATWRKLLAIVCAVAGVLLLHLGKKGNGDGAAGTLLLGAGLVFAAACCEATYTLLAKPLLERFDALLIACLSCLLAVPLVLPLALWQGSGLAVETVDWRGWSAVVWQGVGPIALGSWLWYGGVARAEGTVAAAFMGVMPVSSLLLSYLLLGEAFRWLHLAGFGVVFAGVLLISWEHARMQRAS